MKKSKISLRTKELTEILMCILFLIEWGQTFITTWADVGKCSTFTVSKIAGKMNNDLNTRPPSQKTFEQNTCIFSHWPIRKMNISHNFSLNEMSHVSFSKTSQSKSYFFHPLMRNPIPFLSLVFLPQRGRLVLALKCWNAQRPTV